MADMEVPSVSACHSFVATHDGAIQSLSPHVVIRIPPMDRLSGSNNNAALKLKWTPDHFHPQLRVAQSSNPFLLQWQGRAREGLAIALSTEPKFVRNHPFTQIILGHVGNTQTMVSNNNNNNNNSVRMPGRVCHDKGWTDYWLYHDDHKLYVGIGMEPGTQCIAILNNSNNTDSTEPIPAASSSSSRFYVGFGNAGIMDRQAPVALKIRNIRLESARTLDLSSVTEDMLEPIILHPEEMDEETRHMMLHYQTECRKARARATKFGVPYQGPSVEALLPWSHARRLKANPQAGFVTGLDVRHPEEQAKQEARKARFGNVVATTGAEKSGDATTVDSTVLPIVQAWDNVSLVTAQRTDPPMSLWKIVPLTPPQQQAATTESGDNFMDVEPPTLSPEKIHIFSMDWAAFKQIRTNDIMSYFSGYGPTYVEWLGDLSCNVLFEDKFSAARAVENMSQELPTPPPAELTTPETDREDTVPPDLGAMGWRLCKQALRKVSNDKYGRRGTTARLLFRTATSLDILTERPSAWPKPPPGFSRTRVLGPGSDFPTKGERNLMPKRIREEKPATTWNPLSGEEHPLLSGGLSSKRDGYSVEELEADRAKKKSKLSEGTRNESFVQFTLRRRLF